MTELAGGSFSISSDNKYLFSVWDSDISDITIYDLANKKIILKRETDGEQRYNDIYFQDGKYYVSYDEASVGKMDLKKRK